MIEEYVVQRFWGWLTTVQSAEADFQRRGRTLVILSFGLMIVAAIALPLFLLLNPAIEGVVITSALIAVVACALALARSGKVNLGAALIIAIVIAAPLAGILNSGNITAEPVYFLMAPLIAGVILRPWQIWAVMGLSVLTLLLLVFLLPSNPLATRQTQALVRNTLIMSGVATLIGAVGASNVNRELARTQAARAEAESAAAALECANADLERRVSERTNELSAALATQQSQYHELQASLAAQQRLNELVATLSLPIIPIDDDVLVVPLVGSIDSARAEQLLASVLGQVQAQRARAIMLDVTGVAVVDTYIAQALLRTANATRLLGARTILVGIRPEVAQTLVGLGVDLGTLRTAATLREGLAVIARENIYA
jgi:anti-anti-sigma regulatory factor